jgi:hypothetical protein
MAREAKEEARGSSHWSTDWLWSGGCDFTVGLKAYENGAIHLFIALSARLFLLDNIAEEASQRELSLDVAGSTSANTSHRWHQADGKTVREFVRVPYLMAYSKVGKEGY